MLLRRRIQRFEDGHYLMTQDVARVIVAQVRRIGDVFQMMFGAVFLDLGTGTAQQRPDDIPPFDGDTAQAADPRAARQVPQHRFGVVAAVMCRSDQRAAEVIGNLFQKPIAKPSAAEFETLAALRGGGRKGVKGNDRSLRQSLVASYKGHRG